MFVSSLTIKNYKCFEGRTIKGFNVPDGSPGSGLNVLIGENGTGKTSLLEAINYLTENRFSAGNRLSIHDFRDIGEPIEIRYEASDAFKCTMPQPYAPAYFEANGIEAKLSARKAKASSNPLSSPYTVTQSYRPTTSTYRRKDGADSGKPIEGFARTRDRASIQGTDLSIVYFDKNRSRHLTHGTYKTTFERICDDLNWRFVRELNKDPDKRKALESALSSDYFEEAKGLAQVGVGEKAATQLAGFLDDSRYKNLRVDLINYLHPFEDARLVLREPDSLGQIMTRDLGSGVEVIIALLMLKNVAGASKGESIYLIDEPEAHLHPKAQQSLLALLIEESKKRQIFLSTQSPYMFKDALDQKPGLFTFSSDGSSIDVRNANEIGGSHFPWGPTWGEISYRAFGLPTIEFHNELYGFIQDETSSFSEADIEAYLTSNGVSTAKNWIRLDGGNAKPAYPVTLSTYVRHSIHHPENDRNAAVTAGELEQSILSLSELIEQGL